MSVWKAERPVGSGFYWARNLGGDIRAVAIGEERGELRAAFVGHKDMARLALPLIFDGWHWASLKPPGVDDRWTLSGPNAPRSYFYRATESGDPRVALVEQASVRIQGVPGTVVPPAEWRWSRPLRPPP